MRFAESGWAALVIFPDSSDAPMNFSRRLILLFGLIFFLGEIVGCARRLSPEEKARRSELRGALRAKDWERAIPLARKVVESAPHEDGSWGRLALAQFGKRDLPGLKQTLNSWQQQVERKSFKFDELRGDLALLENRPEEALAHWESAVANKGREARLFRKIARAEQAKRKWQEAALSWTKALTMHETVDGLVNRASCYHHLHSWTAALADLHRAQALAPQQPVVGQEVQRFDRLAKFLEGVAELDRQQRASPNDAGLLGDRALLFLRADDPVLAIDDAEQAAQISPAAVRPRIFATIARALESNAAKSAMSPAIRLEDLSPQFLQIVRRLDAEIVAEPKNAELLTSRAWQLNEIGLATWALADAQNAQTNDPKSAGACAEAAYAFSKLNQRSAAYREIELATQLDPKFSTAWQYRGELEMDDGDYEKAIDSLTRALAINQTAGALTARESCYRMLGQTEKAAEDEKALEQFR